MSYKLNDKGRQAVRDWIQEQAPHWNEWATIEKIDDALANRSAGESLEIEMRGPNWSGGNDGLIFFTPDQNQVDFIEPE